MADIVAITARKDRTQSDKAEFVDDNQLHIRKVAVVDKTGAQAGGTESPIVVDLGVDNDVTVTGIVEVVQDTHDDLNANANIQVGDTDVSTSNSVPVKNVVADSLFTKDFLIEVAKGTMPGHSLVHKFGRNTGVANGTFEFVTILAQTGHVLSAPTTVRVKAGNGADDTGGLGAREITVQGIDDSLNEITEVLATAGAVASSVTAASFWRVHRAWVSAGGTYGGSNTGAVTIENGTGGTDILVIALGEGQSQDAVWSIPTGKTAYLISIHLTAETSKPVDFKLVTRENLDDTAVPVSATRIKHYFDGIEVPFVYRPESPNTSIGGKGDIWIEAMGGAGGGAVSADFELLVVDD